MNAILPESKLGLLHNGTVIPAHPLALDANRNLDPVRQSALTRYYLDAGAGGVAVGVHTTQFEIRQHGLYEDVLTIAADTARSMGHLQDRLMIAGVIGRTDSAIREATLAKSLGYDMALVGLGGLGDWADDDLVKHIAEVGEVLPVFGFYLQPSVGGRRLDYSFWRKVADLESVQAIKIAPFNRYATNDVVRAVCESDRHADIALYTGNDDNIVADLITPFQFDVNGTSREKRIVGGLLGHWAVWTRSVVKLFQKVRAATSAADGAEFAELLTINAMVTDANAAFFDPEHDFAGCIAGIHEVLRRQGLLEGTWCLNPLETMSPGQIDQIDRVYAAYPELADDAFVAENLDRWLSDSAAMLGATR